MSRSPKLILESELLEKGPCPCGQSSDAFATYDDGHGHCFSCDKHVPAGDEPLARPTQSPRVHAGELIDVEEFRELSKRGISVGTCRKFGYALGSQGDARVQIAPYHDSHGRLVAQKIRGPNKTFSVRGQLKLATLFGQNLWRTGGRRVIVTEGEIDAMTVAQVLGMSWPVVSVPNGAAGAANAIKKNLEWLESFEQVIFMFDQDEPGREATEECVALLSPGKAFVASTAPAKDANELLMTVGAKAVVSAAWDVKAYAPDGIINAREARHDAVTPPAAGLSWPWPTLTKATYGIRRRECYAIGAGTGVGKSDAVAEIVQHLLYEHGLKVGCVFLEQAPAETLQRLAGKHVNKCLHVPDDSWTQSELESAVDDLVERDQLYLYDHFGVADWDTVKSRIRYMVTSLGIKDIFLDHLTALAAQAEDERREIESIMADIGSMIQELDFTLYFVSHLATPEGKSHEEGGRVSIRHFKGSRAIGFWSNFMFGMERNQQADEEDERHLTTFRVLKDRKTGRSNGMTFQLRYNQETGRLLEADPSTEAF